MTTSPVLSITEELLAELELHARQAVCDAITDGFPYDPRIGLTTIEENFCATANPTTILALTAHIRSLTERLKEAGKDSWRLDAIEGNCWDVRYNSSPNGDAGDSSISIEIVGHFMADPCERVVGENYHENLRAAIDQAMAADAYPPARPEYDEDEAIAQEGTDHE